MLCCYKSFGKVLRADQAPSLRAASSLPLRGTSNAWATSCKEFVKEMIDNGDVDGDGEIDKDEMF